MSSVLFCYSCGDRLPLNGTHTCWVRRKYVTQETLRDEHETPTLHMGDA